jgi:hypothetical protein
VTKLLLPPDQDAYALAPGALSRAVNYGGGALGIAAEVPGEPFVLAVRWTLTGDQYDYLMAFYRFATAHGSMPFEIDLITISAVITERTARIIPGSLELVTKSADTFVVEAQLEIRATPVAASEDAAIVAAYFP